MQGSLVTSSLQVLDAGVAATLQDGGREGYQRFGVPVSGALDKVSLALANTLAGNAPHEAAVEVLAAGLVNAGARGERYSCGGWNGGFLRP